MTAKQKTLTIRSLFHKILILLPIGVTLNISFVWYQSDLNLSSLINIPVFYLILALFLCLIPLIFHGIRVLLWLRFFQRRISLREALYIGIGNDLGSALSPTAIGGEAVKTALIMQQGLPLGSAVSLTLISRLEEMLFLSIMIVITMVSMTVLDWSGIVSFSLPEISVYHLLIIALLASIAWLIFRNLPPGRIRQMVEKFRQDTRLVFSSISVRGKRIFLLTSLISVVQWSMKYHVVYVLMLGLGFEGDYLTVLAFQWVIFMLMGVIPTPGAAVGAEASFLLLYGAIMLEQTALILMFYWRMFTYYIPLFLGSIAFMILHRHRLSRKTASPHPAEVLISKDPHVADDREEIRPAS